MATVDYDTSGGRPAGNNGVTWSVVATSGDTDLDSGTSITSGGVLTAGPGESNTSLTVTATSSEDVTKTGTATVTVSTDEVTPAVDSVDITGKPSGNTMQRGTTFQFAAFVVTAGMENGTVTWSVAGGSAGTSITSGGKLTVGADETNGTITVTATSTDDPSKYASVTISLTDAP
jgi:hypothetical protein